MEAKTKTKYDQCIAELERERFLLTTKVVLLEEKNKELKAENEKEYLRGYTTGWKQKGEQVLGDMRQAVKEKKKC